MPRCLLALLALLALAPGCTTMERPEVHVTNITPLESTLFEQRMQVDLRLQNPNPTDLALRGLDFTLDVNHRRLARGLSNEPIVVPALGEAEATIITSTTLFDLVRQASGLGVESELTYQLSGRVHLDSGFGRTLRIEQSETLTALPRLGYPADRPLTDVILPEMEPLAPPIVEP
ncbi:MAG: LEA type 2 family protein [Phycisphaerales bacterium]|nr:LEA type 2 family protein [Phycisphaerales bacterium]NNM26519.1 LEA type 2 family protein [Phycisphaerales bacterium]